jgi:transposase InsO family protein
MIDRYKKYNWTKQDICRKWGISPQRFDSLENHGKRNTKTPIRLNPNKITEKEKDCVIEYALSHTHYNHRELSYRMIDENIAYMSSSSVYRILRENNLIVLKGKRRIPQKWDPHAKLTKPDELWQTDLMNIFYRGRDYYFFSYIDVFSRYITYHELLASMTGDTIKNATEEAFRITGKKPKSIQSDNGSCYISQEYKTCISKFKVESRYIHPHCPNENAEIERYHRTLRELVDPNDAENFDALHKLIKEQVDYYNHERYHSAIGFITPYDKYTGKAEKIFSERTKKLQRAKERRVKENLNQYENQKAA